MKKFWLSRERSGSYMATRLRPEKHRILGTKEYEFYVPYGDPIGLRHWCAAGVRAFFGVDIPIGEQIEVVEVSGKTNKIDTNNG